MYCQKCGVQVEDQARYCYRCGAALAGAGAEPAGPPHLDPKPAAPSGALHEPTGGATPGQSTPTPTRVTSSTPDPASGRPPVIAGPTSSAATSSPTTSRDGQGPEPEQSSRVNRLAGFGLQPVKSSRAKWLLGLGLGAVVLVVVWSGLDTSSPSHNTPSPNYNPPPAANVDAPGAGFPAGAPSSQTDLSQIINGVWRCQYHNELANSVKNETFRYDPQRSTFSMSGDEHKVQVSGNALQANYTAANGSPTVLRLQFTSPSEAEGQLAVGKNPNNPSLKAFMLQIHAVKVQ